MTTDYLNFSEPKAMETLAGLKNITLKMYVTEEAREGFHTKGYIFKKEELYRIIIGSSNMTQSALTTNREWNTKIVSAEQENTHRMCWRSLSSYGILRMRYRMKSLLISIRKAMFEIK